MIEPAPRAFDGTRASAGPQPVALEDTVLDCPIVRLDEAAEPRHFRDPRLQTLGGPRARRQDRLAPNPPRPDAGLRNPAMEIRRIGEYRAIGEQPHDDFEIVGCRQE